MDERSRDEEQQDDVRLPEERVEDLEPEDEDSAGIAGGKVSLEYKPPPTSG